MDASIIGSIIEFIGTPGEHSKEELFLLDHLESLPVSEIESRAKAKGAFHPKECGCDPQSGDVVTFSMESFPNGPHVGIVNGTTPDGQLEIVTGDPYRSKAGHSNSEENHPVRHRITISPSEVRGDIWKNRSQATQGSGGTPRSERQERGYQENLVDLLSDLLRPASTK